MNKVIQLPEGKNMGNTILRAIARARRERLPVVIVREYTTSAGALRSKAILFVSPEGDVSEALVPTLRVPFAEFVVEHAVELAVRSFKRSLVELEATAPERLLMFWKDTREEASRKRAA